MSQVKASFTGNIVAAPDLRETPNGATLLEFPVYVNHTKKNRDTEQYEKTGDTTKIRVTLWGDLANNTDVRMGDLVEVSATLVEKEFQTKDGSTGRSLQTDWVESIVVKHRKEATAPAGFNSEEPF